MSDLWIIDDAFPAELVRAADAEWPDESWPHWLRYDGDDASKLATKDESRLPPACRELCNMMCRLDISDMTGVEGTFADHLLHAGGMHALPSGGHLGVHLDCDHHPIMNWKREFSVILFVNEEWEPEWNGALELWTGDGSELAEAVEQKFNRLTLFRTTGRSYHGVPKPVRCPEGEMRKTLAVFYWSRPQPGDTFQRQRAEFI